VIVARDTGGFDEGRGGVIGRGDCPREAECLNALSEDRPAFEAVLAGDHELCVGEMERSGPEGCRRLAVQPRVMLRDAIERVRQAIGMAAD
jgi:hypothetical protein